MRSLAAFWSDVLDAVLGPRCPLGCGTRLFDRDRERHFRDEHAGDEAGPDSWQWLGMDR